MQNPTRTPQKAPQPGAFLHSGAGNTTPPKTTTASPQAVSQRTPNARARPEPGLYLAALLVAALSLLALPPAALARTESVTVRHVLDGDTVILADERQIRLIGINTPELGKDGQPDQPLAAAARDRLRDLAQGKQVRLVFEDESRDRYGRWLAHLDFDDGTSAEDILIKEGLAWAVAIPPNIARLARHRQTEAAARSARRGLWAQAGYSPVPAESLTATETGFRFVRGRVTHVGRSRKFVYLDMGPRFALRIGHHDWERYFQGDPGQWRGVPLEARGWVSEYQGRLHLSIGHPAMLERLP